MTQPAPIPREQFHEAVASLNTAAFAAFVGDIWTETAASVTVDPPVVVVHAADGRVTRLRTVAAAAIDELGDDDAAAKRSTATTGRESPTWDETDGITTDVVVAASRDTVAHLGDQILDASNDSAAANAPDDTSTGGHGTQRVVYSADDLRNRLLYELTPATADRLCVDALGVSLRSTAYPTVTTTRAESAVDASTDTDSGQAGVRDATDGRTGRVRTTTPLLSGSERAHTREPDAYTRESDTSEASTTATRSSGDADGQNALYSRGGRIAWRPVVAAVAVVMLVAIGGAATLVTGDGVGGIDGIGELSGIGGIGGLGNADGGGAPDGRTAGDATDDASQADPPDVATGDGGATVEGESPPHYYADGIGSDDSAERVDGGDAELAATTAANRSTALEPTCDRPPLLVVQIQMNALRHNDPTTNDGIRTTRRFASPGNRRTVGSFARFVELFETSTYAPMLSYDSAEYVPERVDGDVAEIRVVTRENGTVTAGYTFRLRQIGADDGSITGGSAGYDGCWMTDSVVASEPAGTD